MIFPLCAFLRRAIDFMWHWTKIFWIVREYYITRKQSISGQIKVDLVRSHTFCNTATLRLVLQSVDISHQQDLQFHTSRSTLNRRWFKIDDSMQFCGEGHFNIDTKLEKVNNLYPEKILLKLESHFLSRLDVDFWSVWLTLYTMCSIGCQPTGS